MSELPQPARVPLDRTTLPPPPESLLTCAARLLAKETDAPQRRAAKRHAGVMSVAVMPLDDQFQPAGAAFMAMTRDLSTSGLRLVTDRAVDDKYLAVDLTLPPVPSIQVALEVIRCEPVGKYYEIAGPLVARME